MASPTRPETPELAQARARIEALEHALEQALADAHACRVALQRSQSALSAIADGIVVTDLEGRITSINPVAAHLTGWPEHESPGKPLREVVRTVESPADAVDLLPTGLSHGSDATLPLFSTV